MPSPPALGENGTWSSTAEKTQKKKLVVVVVVGAVDCWDAAKGPANPTVPATCACGETGDDLRVVHGSTDGVNGSWTQEVGPVRIWGEPRGQIDPHNAGNPEGLGMPGDEGFSGRTATSS